MGNANQSPIEEQPANVNEAEPHKITPRWLGEVTTKDTDHSFSGVSVGGAFHDDTAAKIAELVGIQDYES